MSDTAWPATRLDRVAQDARALNTVRLSCASCWSAFSALADARVSLRRRHSSDSSFFCTLGDLTLDGGRRGRCSARARDWLCALCGVLRGRGGSGQQGVTYSRAGDSDLARFQQAGCTHRWASTSCCSRAFSRRKVSIASVRKAPPAAVGRTAPRGCTGGEFWSSSASGWRGDACGLANIKEGEERSPRKPRQHGQERYVSEAPSRTVAHMEASSSVPNELAQLLQSIIRTLPPHELELVLSHLPMPELARLSCVHKAFLVAWRSLREQHPGRRYAPPSRGELNRAKAFRRLERAAFLGDVAVIRSAVAAGRRLQARDGLGSRKVDKILWHAADGGRVQSLELLLTLGASVRSRHDHALLRASGNGHTDAVQFLIQRGANVHADHDVALRQASSQS